MSRPPAKASTPAPLPSPPDELTDLLALLLERAWRRRHANAAADAAEGETLGPIVAMASGRPHPLWSDKAASPLKRVRVTASQTQEQVAQAAAPCSVSAYANLEARGIGSDDLWRRVAAVFGVPVESIKPSPARRTDDHQLALPGTGGPGR